MPAVAAIVRDPLPRLTRLLERFRLPGRVADRFPGELSGGERQRVALARALAANPRSLICDEVTSSLDVSVQAAVLELLAELRKERRVALLFISHDLGVVAAIADNVWSSRADSYASGGPRAGSSITRKTPTPGNFLTRLHG